MAKIKNGDMITTRTRGLLYVTDVAEFDNLINVTRDFDMEDVLPDPRIFTINADLEVLTVNGAKY